MRVLLDTNVLVSGLASRTAAPGALLHAWRAGIFELVVSDPLITEVARTLQKPYFLKRLTNEQITQAIILLYTEGQRTVINVTVTGIASHTEDDLVLAAAVSGHADYLVTGDRDLQKLTLFQGVTVLSPRAFLDLITPNLEV
ncbi:MAG: putative toxin-antitoxin system toxin component, PIN family [Herpetosiphonaceae bacterium]|nr:putative toxin-antitoxin system toxin component, PIN family [Herpetosiphonaceae bacterium]